MKYFILGLGNPGDEYQGSRHNVGQMMLDSLRKGLEFPEWQLDKKIKVWMSRGKVGKHELQLLKPDIFMNNNGKVLPTFIKSKKEAERLIVIYDELDLPIGKIKLSYGRSSGGHRGLESVIKSIKTKDFLRIRVGISGESKGVAKKPKGEDAVIKFILGKFKDDDLAVLNKESKKIVEAVKTIMDSGREKAMSQFN